MDKIFKEIYLRLLVSHRRGLELHLELALLIEQSLRLKPGHSGVG